jgi:multiple sugar transport system substrate-binding protein
MKAFARWITLLIVLSLAACTAPATPQPPAATEAPVATEAPATKTTIHVLTMEQAGPTVDEMNAIVAEFNKANPNIEVLIDYVAYDALHDKIVTALASTPPAYDVFLVDDIWYAEFASKGYSLDVTNRITPDMKAGIFDAAWQIPTVNGVVFGLPWLLDQKYFFYNTKLLKDAGFDNPPATWEELVDQAKVIKEKKIVDYPIVWSWGQYEAAVCDWVTLLYGMGGQMADKDGKPAFNSPAGVKALTWMVQTIDDGITNPSSISYVEEDVRNVFS